MASAINQNTVAIVGSAGNYPYGLIDPMESLSEIALKHDIGLHYTLEQRGVTSCYIIGLWDGNRIPLGFVIVDFCRNKKCLNQSDRQQFRAVSMKVCGLLMSGGRGQR